MIIAIGRVETRKLIDDLIQVAKGNNELHEKNPEYGRLKHSDGWGIAYLKDQKWRVYKSLKPIFEDDNIYKFRSLKTRAIVLHARKSTGGNITYDNTHPLVYNDRKGDYLFTHNGTIYDEFDFNEPLIAGDSDSVRWFNKLISELKNNDIPDFFSLDRFTSANFFFVTPGKIYVGQYFKKDPVYHTMKVIKNGNNVIVSSEILPAYKDEIWQSIENGSLLQFEY